MGMAKTEKGYGKEYNYAYEALEQELRQSIYARRLRSDQKLHSEMQFARNWKISRSTVRKAFDHLEGEGLIRRVKGSGTFVIPELNRMKRQVAPSKGNIRGRQVLFLSFSTWMSEDSFQEERTFGPIFNGLSKVLNLYRYNLLFSHVNMEWQPPACLLNDDVVGIIFHGYVKPEFWDTYMKHFPCVAIQYAGPEFECNCVKLDNFRWFHQAVWHLYGLGHRQIGYFAITRLKRDEDSFFHERKIAFLAALDHFGLKAKPQWCVEIYRPVNGEITFDYTMPDYSGDIASTMTSPPTAVITESNGIAFYEALRKLGKRVPEDISLITQSNDIFQPYGKVNFTYMCDRLENICTKGAQLMVDILDAAVPVDNITVLVHPKLILGNTTRRIPSE
ncbi:MAG: Arabinose metabolism transcriptional repressor [Lentisphaerae bacterium ADurb.Bin242]|nr:MAG: Arabinose metabolism transcriptional repressor [Lentisphaerae bacterium ADurb.Bin242]